MLEKELMLPPVSSAVSKESKLVGWNERPKSKRPFPIVSARSAKTGPKVVGREAHLAGCCDPWCTQTRRTEEGKGNVVSPSAIALFNSRGVSSSASVGIKCAWW